MRCVLTGGIPSPEICTRAMAQSIQARRLPQRPPVRRARYISEETWNYWKDGVYERYIHQNQSLQQIMDEYNDQYNFTGTYVLASTSSLGSLTIIQKKTMERPA